MSEYEVVQFRADQKDEVVEFRSQVWDSDLQKCRAYLEWKYERNPYIREPIFYLAMWGGKVVGMRGVYGTCWQVGDKRIILPAVDDLAVSAEHRHKGIVKMLMEVTEQDLTRRGFDTAVSLSPGQVTALVSLAAGWKSVLSGEPSACFSPRRRCELGVRNFLRNKRVIWRLARRHYPLRDSSTRPFRRLDDASGGSAAGFTVCVEKSPRPEAMAELILRLPDDGRIRQARDAEFYRWRFQDPTREYRFLFLENGAGLVGFLVISRYIRYRPPTLPYHVASCEGLSTTHRHALMSYALSQGCFDELGVWMATVPVTDRSELAAAGFVPISPDLRARGLPCVLVRSLSGGRADNWCLAERKLTDPAQWDLQLIYTMHG